MRRYPRNYHLHAERFTPEAIAGYYGCDLCTKGQRMKINRLTATAISRIIKAVSPSQ